MVSGMSPAAAARRAVISSALSGWCVVAGVLVTIALGSAPFSPLGFAAGSLLAVVSMRRGDALRYEREWPPPAQGRLPWFSGIASMTLLSSDYLRARATEAGWPPRGVLALVWAPWWALFSGYLLLWINAAIQLIP